MDAKVVQWYEDIKQYLLSLKNFQYLLVTEHIGQDNKHYHAYVQYSKPAYLSYRKLHGAHVDKCFGSAQQNIRYLKCEDDKHKISWNYLWIIDEEGDPLLKGGNYTVGYLESLEDPYELPAIHYNIYNKIQNKKSDEAFYNMLDSIQEDALRPIEVIYFIGKPGSGKT
jgi:hypothetical protein